jgi:hypothetical protein
MSDPTKPATVDLRTRAEPPEPREVIARIAREVEAEWNLCGLTENLYEEFAAEIALRYARSLFTEADAEHLERRAENCRQSEEHARELMHPERMRDAREAAELYESIARRLRSLQGEQPEP